jgi:polar amino acid transport system substrate-binding protein
MIKRRWLWLALITLGMGVALARWQWPPDPSLQRIAAAGVVRIGYAVEAPYAFVDSGGDVRGEAPETARLIVAQLGIERVEWVQVRFAELQSGLLERRFDVVAAGLFITPGRARQIAFSAPVLAVSSGLLVPQRRAATMPDSYAGLVSRGELRVAVLSDSVEHQRLLALGMPAARLLLVPDAHTGRVAVREGQVQALALSLPTLRLLATPPGAGPVTADSSTAEPLTTEHLTPGLLASDFLSPEVLTPEVLTIIPLRAADRGLTQRDYTAFAFHPRDRRWRQAWDAAQRQVLGTAAHSAILQRLHFTGPEVQVLSRAAVSGAGVAGATGGGND